MYSSKLITTNSFKILEQEMVQQATVENEQEASTKKTKINVQKTIKTKISPIVVRKKLNVPQSVSR